MPVDYIPQNDDEFADWLENFLNVANANLAAFGFVAADTAPLAPLLVQLKADNTDLIPKEAAFHAAVQKIETSRGLADPPARKLMQRAQLGPGATPALISQAGGTVRKTTRTRHGVPTEVPGIFVEVNGTQVIVHFGTNPNNEQLNSKPVGAKGVNVYRQMPGEPAPLLIAFDTGSPYIDTVTGPAKNITYRVAYRGTNERDIGPLSPEQTVAAGG